MAAAFLLYQKRGSAVEGWDPRVKITASLLLGAALLITGEPGVKTGLLAVLVLLWGLARLPWKTLGYTLLTLTLFFASTLIFQAVLSVRPDETLIRWGAIRFSAEGALRGVLLCEQIAGIVLLLSLLVRTTSPIHLAEGLELLLKPLARRRLPVHEAVMMFQIALRFLPILADEFDKIRKSQLARGGGFHRGGVRARFGGVFPMLMPLFVTSIMRAQDLAVAMDSRCYQGGDGRTPIRAYRFAGADYAVLAAAFVGLAAAVVW